MTLRTSAEDPRVGEFNESHNTAVRKASGEVVIDSKLTSFIYELLRDHIPSGVIEKVLRNSLRDDPTHYCNGWLAKYAEYVANQLTKPEKPSERGQEGA